MLWHSLGELTLTDDGRRQDRIGGRNTRSANKTLQPIERTNHPPDEKTRNQPAPCHDREQKEHNRPPMAFHVGLRQFDTDGETLHDKDNAGAFQRDFVDVTPFVGIEEVRRMGAEDDTANGGDGSFADVQFLLDEQGAQHEQAGETAQDHVSQMRLIDIEVVPGHGENSGCGDFNNCEPGAQRFVPVLLGGVPAV